MKNSFFEEKIEFIDLFFKVFASLFPQASEFKIDLESNLKMYSMYYKTRLTPNYREAMFIYTLNEIEKMIIRYWIECVHSDEAVGWLINPHESSNNSPLKVRGSQITYTILSILDNSEKYLQFWLPLKILNYMSKDKDNRYSPFKIQMRLEEDYQEDLIRNNQERFLNSQHIKTLNQATVDHVCHFLEEEYQMKVSNLRAKNILSFLKK